MCKSALARYELISSLSEGSKHFCRIYDSTPHTYTHTLLWDALLMLLEAYVHVHVSTVTAESPVNYLNLPDNLIYRYY